ncbi:MAG TPA: hypothetical protein DCM32_07885 [Xanthomonadaceae bacterium]|jgi:diguanylate cyclase (GGDEF)-like protein/PAS domain S-box-containing protein|nr:hypothetical protein [Xanthomonadaceae bacterium]
MRSLPSPAVVDPVAIAGTFADAAALAHGLTTSTGVMMAFFDRTHRVGWVNARYAEWFGVRPEALVGRTVAEVYGDSAYALAAPRIDMALAGQPMRYERLLDRPGDGPRWISVSLHPHRDTDGRVLGVFACSVEVDELRRTRDALDRSLQEIAIYLENSPLAVVEWDRAGRVRRWGGQAERMFGWSAAETTGRSADELSLVHPDGRSAADASLQALLDGRELRNRMVCRNLMRDGQAFHCEWFQSAFVDSTGSTQGVLSLGQDVNARVEAEEQLRHAANHDALTGCHNRWHLVQRIERALNRARCEGSRLALLYFDLDRFKPVNDRHGHATGDALLRAAALRLRAAAPEADCIARVGGDEFVVLLADDRSPAAAEALRAAMAQRFREPFEIGTLRLEISASIGIAHHPEHGDSPDALLREADDSMYREKNAR